MFSIPFDICMLYLYSCIYTFINIGVNTWTMVCEHPSGLASSTQFAQSTPRASVLKLLAFHKSVTHASPNLQAEY